MEKRTPANTPLPTASGDGLSGLAEMIAHRAGRADLAVDLGLEVDDILPLVDALDLLGFARVHGDDLLLTDTGTEFAGADVQKSKTIFAEAALGVPLVRLITGSLRQNPDGALLAGFFRDVLAQEYRLDAGDTDAVRKGETDERAALRCRARRGTPRFDRRGLPAARRDRCRTHHRARACTLVLMGRRVQRGPPSAVRR